ncbi:speckle-type POZ protein-like [Paramacrobiotus metropolitanus]|uniref:speckle-type POZ protein-like n=1 Tax=Paramacrobiotus metropolitanus TaxID=2943436 RepID=UPI0024457534|nr:speckle-type POZ protein-like [Paramacrobiotus metropolitanus]
MDKKPIVVKDCSSHDAVHFVLHWTIRDFTLYKGTQKWINSPGITLLELGVKSFTGRFRISVNPCVKADNNSQYVGVYLKLTDAEENSTAYNGPAKVYVASRISGTTGNAMDVEINQPVKTPLRYLYSPGSSSGWETFVSYAQLFGTATEPGLLKDDVVAFKIEATMYGSGTAEVPEVKNVRLSKIEPPATLCYQDFRRRQMEMYRAEIQLFCDFLLRSSDGREFRVHRFLLAAHSPVFLAMLTHDSQEKQQSHCEVTDLDGECVEILVDYLYGCETNKLNADNVEKALIMADKYQIMDLRSVCEGMIAESVTVENAVDRLIMARQRGLDVLKDTALRIMAQNKLVVLKDKVLKAAIQSDPDLLEIIMEYCAT